MEYKTLSHRQTTLKFSDSKHRIFSGYASVFNEVDSYGDVILPGAFATTIKKDKTVGMFFNHASYDVPVGKWLDFKEDAKGLWVEGELTQGHPMADTLKAALLHGTVQGLSIGFISCKDDYQPNGEGNTYSQISELFEISLCTYPACDQALISQIKAQGFNPNHMVNDEAIDVWMTKKLAIIQQRQDQKGALKALLQSIKQLPQTLTCEKK